MSVLLDQIRSQMSARNYEAALRLIDQLGKENGNSPRLLLLKAACLELSDGGTLEEVERTFLRAIELDDEYVEGFLELGWFRANVQDEASGAKGAFDRARELLKKQIAETFRDVLACAQELRPSQTASASGRISKETSFRI